MSYSVVHNQILKATMRRLIRTHDLAPELSEAFHKSATGFPTSTTSS